MGTHVWELKEYQSSHNFKFTHVMTSAAVNNFFDLRVLQVGFQLGIPTLMPRVSIQRLNKDLHVFDTKSRTIQNVNPFCDGELQSDQTDAEPGSKAKTDAEPGSKAKIDNKPEKRNIVIVETHLKLDTVLENLNLAIYDEMQAQVKGFFGYFLDKEQIWSTTQPFPQKWSTILKNFLETKDEKVFDSFLTTEQTLIKIRFDPLPHVVTDCVLLGVEKMVQYSENPDEFFQFVKSSFESFFVKNHFYLLDKESLPKEHVELDEEEQIDEEVVKKQKRLKATKKQRAKRARRKEKASVGSTKKKQKLEGNSIEVADQDGEVEWEEDVDEGDANEDNFDKEEAAMINAGTTPVRASSFLFKLSCFDKQNPTSFLSDELWELFNGDLHQRYTFIGTNTIKTDFKNDVTSEDINDLKLFHNYLDEKCNSKSMVEVWISNLEKWLPQFSKEHLTSDTGHQVEQGKIDPVVATSSITGPLAVQE